MAVLRRPVVVTPAAVPFVATPIKVTIVRIRPQRTLAGVRRPRWIGAGIYYRGVLVRLAYSRRGVPRSVLRPPASTAVARPARPIQVTFARRLPALDRRPRSRLSPPLVVNPGPTYVGPAVRLTAPAGPVEAYWERRPKSKLGTPKVLTTTFVASPIKVTLVRITPPRTLAGVRRPRWIGAGIFYRGILTHLAYSKRGRPKSRLSPPVSTPEVTTPARPILVKLAPSTRPVAKSRLSPVPAAFQPVGTLTVTLAPSRRPLTKSRLSLTKIIDLRPQVYYLSTTLVRIVPPPTIARLSPPVDTVGLEDQGSVSVTLAYSLRGRPKSKLRPPTDLVDEQDKGHLRVTLAPSPTQARRAHWKLSPPTVVTPNTPHRGIVVELARTPRTKTIWRLPVPASAVRVVEIFPAEIVQFVRITPPPVISKLGPPVVIDLSPQVRSISTWLAYSRRGRPIYRLRPPTDLVDAQDLGRVRVTLARNKVKPTRYRLRPPTVVVEGKAETILAVTLVRIRPPRTLAFSTGVTYLPPLARPIEVSLTRIRPPRTMLRAPGVIYAAPLSPPVKVTLAPSVRGRPIHFLRPPAAIDLSPQVYVISTTFVRIRPVRVYPILRPPTAVTTECYGAAVCGFDFAAEVSGSDAAALAQGTVSGAEACGEDSAATTEGATASRGSVTGGDERREGC